jgi:Family of unknown function (DUF6152)
MKRTMLGTGLGLALILAAGGAYPHHSVGGEFGDERVTVEGVVTDFRLINPHSYIVLDVGEGAATTRWTLTLGPANRLIRGSGWTSEILVPGERVTSTGRAARSGNGMYVARLVKADGTMLLDELQE